MIIPRKFLRRTFPRATVLFQQGRSALARLRHGDGNIRVFDDIMYENRWEDGESVSGEGSTLRETERVRAAIPAIISRIGAKAMVDAPCGDFNWMRLVDLGGVRYTGFDVVAPLVERCQTKYGDATHEFRVGNIVIDVLPHADLIMCRDCLVHLSYNHIFAALTNFRQSGAKYLLTTTNTSRSKNWDIVSGDWRPLNLQAAPFRFPDPLELIVEGSTEAEGDFVDKSLGLWRLDSLPLPR